MKPYKFILIPSLVFCFKFSAFAQQVSCSELYEYVLDNYDHKKNASILQSSMLVKVSYYEIDDSGVVVAHIKQNDWDLTGKPYIFCGISRLRWNSFTNAGIFGSWGEAFHDYIMDYTCDCN